MTASRPRRPRKASSLRLDVVTIFPEMFAGVLRHSILKRAQANGALAVHLHNLRDFTHDKRRTVDDRPYGGGPGMVFKPEPIFEAIDSLRTAEATVILPSPQGERFNFRIAQELSKASHLIFICARYEGVDERVCEELVDREISIGDYVVTGGELPAMVVIDSVVRLLPGAIGHEAATVEESFSNGLLEYPQYTRPVTFLGMTVPAVLRSGDHQAVARWRKLHAVARTMSHRPDLMTQATQQQARRTHRSTRRGGR